MSELPYPEMNGSLDIAEKILARFENEHDDPEQVRGLIMIQRAITEEVHAMFPCHPSITQGGQLVCSLASVINALHSLLLAANLQATCAIQLDRVGKDTADDRTIGQFL